MAINFPNSPSSGDTHTVSGKIWQWDGEKWKAYGASISPGVLKIDAANNRVGINQTTPTVALDVTGSARITGDLTVSGTTVTVDSASVLVKDRVQFEGATANDYETVLLATDPTADRTITLPDSTGTVALSAGNVATATEATNVTVVANNSTDETVYPTFVDGATSTQGIETDTGLTYNPSTGVLTSTGFTGAVIGNVTGNASGTALTVTQAAQTAITSVGTLTSLAVSGGLVAPIQVPTAKTASYTLVLADAGKLIQMNVGSANNLTIPPNSSVDFDVGTQIIITQIGAGATTIVDGSGVTTNSKDNKAAIDGQYSSVSLLQTADDTWLVTGALA